MTQNKESEQTQLTALIQKKLFEANSKPIMLLNSKREPVAALYTNNIKFNIEDIVICQCSESVTEKYYLYLGGIAIFFTYFRID